MIRTPNFSDRESLTTYDDDLIVTSINGESELRLITGEIFHLGDKSITRIICCRDSARQEAFSYQANYTA